MAEESVKTIYDHLVSIYSVSIMPMTILLLVSWFKSEFKAFFRDLKTFKATSDGLEFERHLGRLEGMVTDEIIAKSTGLEIDQKFSRDRSLSPKAQVMEWQKVFRSSFQTKSKERQLTSKEWDRLHQMENMVRLLPDNLDDDRLETLKNLYLKADIG